MTIQEHQITTEYKARYYTQGPSISSNQVWLVLHGYGQLAEYFIKNFSLLARNGHTVIAPEALNRFYLKGFSGRVGATWMTKEDRLTDIDNYIVYLNALCETLIPKDYAINVLGFSQGAATASRFISHTNQPIASYVQWGGKFPSDVPLASVSSPITWHIPIRLVWGKQDEYLNEQELQAEISFFKGLTTDFQSISYQGGHQITEKALEVVCRSLKI